MEARSLFRNRHRLLVHVLVLGLLIAQLGMEAHAYSHFKTDPDSVPGTIQGCGQCLSFSPLTSMVGSSHSVRLPHRTEDDRVAPAGATGLTSYLLCQAFRSRAPPYVL